MASGFVAIVCKFYFKTPPPGWRVFLTQRVDRASCQGTGKGCVVRWVELFTRLGETAACACCCRIFKNILAAYVPVDCAVFVICSFMHHPLKPALMLLDEQICAAICYAVALQGDLSLLCISHNWFYTRTFTGHYGIAIYRSCWNSWCACGRPTRLGELQKAKVNNNNYQGILQFHVVSPAFLVCDLDCYLCTCTGLVQVMPILMKFQEKQRKFNENQPKSFTRR